MKCSKCGLFVVSGASKCCCGEPVIGMPHAKGLDSGTRPSSAKLPGLSFALLAAAVLSVPALYVLLLAIAALALGTAGILVYAAIGAGANLIAVQVIAPAALGGLYAAYGVLAGIYHSLRPQDRIAAEPGLVLNAAEEPELLDLVNALCAKMGCRRPNAIVMSSRPVFAVTQGALVVLAHGRSPVLVRGRILIIGHPLIATLTVSEFRSVLAHELAHFTGRDTLYSTFVVPVYVGVETALDRMFAFRHEQHGGCASIIMWIPGLLPALILRVYVAGFHVLNAAVSRSRETRADVLAALCTGADTVGSALRKIVRESEVFTIACDRHYSGMLPVPGSRVRTYYDAYRALVEKDPEMLIDVERSAKNRRGRITDFHPALLARLRALPRGREANPDRRPAHLLVADFAEKEQAVIETYSRLLGLTHGTHGDVSWQRQPL